MWKLDGTNASLDVNNFIADLDIAKPHAGLRLASNNGPVDHSLGQVRVLQLHFPSELAVETDNIRDMWTRGTDVVAVYGETARRVVQPEVYWRLVPGASVGLTIELIVSVQTDLLDASPRTRIRSEVPADEVAWLTSPDDEAATRLLHADSQPVQGGPGEHGLFVIRRLGSPWSYVEMIHCLDYSSANLDWCGGNVRLETQLFLESLEKGVIRRGRARGMLIPRQGDLAAATAAYRDFCQSPPPLTT